MKKAKYENFVGVYDNYFSAEFCDSLVEYFEWCLKNNRTYSREEAERLKKDDSACLNPMSITEINYAHPNLGTFISEFNTVFWDECYTEYRAKYSVLDDYDTHTIYTYKVQKTEPTGGYHLWHCEDGSKTHNRRIGVYILYLNDVEEGGETEFIYQSQRVKAEKGRLLVFPPNYPWAHRGNPPISGNKYIMTGWIEFS